MSYDTSNFALQVAYPDNIMILDDRDMPSIFVRYPFATVKELIKDQTDGSTHPAFLIDGEQTNEIMIGKFPGVSHDDRIYSLPATTATTYITLDQYVQRCRAKGKGHHCITAAEWAFLALNAKKHKTQPKGNNNWGKDYQETEYVALRGNTDERSDAGANKGKTAQALTGTGPDTWFDNHTKSGVWGLNGNIWEWCAGLRLVYGEVQVIPYNNAAKPDIDLSTTSPEWKAINGDATAWTNIYISPDGKGTTTNSVKMDYLTNKWTYTKGAITSKVDSSRSCAFKDIAFGEGLTDFCKNFLRVMALAPEADDSDYTGTVWANNAQAERCAFRGADWSYGADAGVFALDLSNPRASSWVSIGGRPAFASWGQ